jgi:hypothetical protein
MEKKAIEKSRKVEADRKKELENQKKKNAKIALEKKLQMRAVNIEIGSALIDLIVDVAEQTYDTTLQNPNHKVSKKDWREYMDVFKKGKRVTVRNVVKKPVHEEATEVSMHSIEFRNDQSVNGLCFEYQES